MSDPDDARPIELVLEHSDWVRALAYRLVHDADVAEDVVQKTWLAALRSPPKSPGKVRAWLRTVVRNLVREAHRSEQSRAAFELIAARDRDDVVPSAAELAEKAELLELVAGAIGRLTEDHRNVVMLHYHEHLTLPEISDHLGIPMETAKTRLRRALARLRELVSEKAKRGGTTLGALLAPLLVGLPSPDAANVAASTATPASSTSASTGRRVVRWAVLAASATIVAWIAATAPWDAGTRPLPSASGRAVADANPSERTARRRAGAAAETDASADPSPLVASGTADASAAASTTGASGTSLAADVIGAEGFDGLHLAVTPIFAAPKTSAGGAIDAVVSDGRIAVDTSRWSDPANPLLAVEVIPDHPSFVRTASRAPVALRAGALSVSSPLRVFPAAIVTGRVSVPAGSTHVARAAAFRVGGNGARLIDVTDCSRDGTFRLRVWPDEEHRVVVGAEGAVPASCVVTAGTSAPADLGSFPLATGLGVSGTVREADGRQLAGPVTVHVQPRFSGDAKFTFAGLAMGLFGSEVRVTSVEVPTGPDGSFAVTGLSPGEYRITAAGLGLAGDVIDGTEKWVTLPATGIDIALGGWPLQILARGVPDGALVAVQPSVGPLGTGLAIVGERATLRGNPGTQYTIKYSPKGGTQLVGVGEPSIDDPGRTIELRPVERAIATAQLVLTLPEDTDVRTVALRFFASDAAPHRLPAASLDATLLGGAATVTVPLTGRYRVVANPGTTLSSLRTGYVEATATLDLSEAEPARWELVPARGGQLRIVCRDPRGRPASGLCRITREGNEMPVRFALRSPSFAGYSTGQLCQSGVTDVAGALPPGAYVVEITGHDKRMVSIPAVLVAGEETLVTAVLGER